MSLEPPQCEAHGGSSHARGKRPPTVEINSFSSYPKNTDLRTNTYFVPDRLLGYSADTSCTSRGQEPLTESVERVGTPTIISSYFTVISTVKLTTTLLDGMNNRKCLRWGEHLRAAPVPKLTKRVFYFTWDQ